MGIGFISLALRKTKSRKTRSTMNAGFIIVSTYLFQGIIGMIMAYGFNLFNKNVSPIIGLLLPLGFGQGPGQAFSIGSQWEKLGLLNGSSIGLAVAAAGFTWATIGGIIFLNIFAHGNHKKPRVKVIEKKVLEVKDYEFSDMDGMTIQLVIIGGIYFAVMVFLTLLEKVLAPLGALGETFATVMWGFHFVFGAIFAMLFRKIYDKLHEKGITRENYLNNFILQRIAGGVFDFMVAASISAVVYAKISTVFFPLFVITFLGGIFTYIYISYVVKKTMKDYIVENTLAFFGMLTGTISTGMALLREVDPALETGTAENLVFGSGFSIFVGIPMIAVLNVPAFALRTGNSVYFLYTLLTMLAYGFFLYIVWFRRFSKST
ncbi:MAG: glutamate:Na+ symporter, family [Kosmotoga sp.]|nr:glutamate:Na+ symporter, family [Kosmotoga sp.]